MGTSQAASRSGITLKELNDRIGSKALAGYGQKLDFDLIEYCRRVMEQTFPQLLKAEKAKDKSRYALAKDIYFTAATLGLRHIDETGLTAAVGRLVHHLHDFSFEDNVANLYLDYSYLVSTFKVPEGKARRFWRSVDERKSKIIRMMSKTGFRFESTMEGAKIYTDAPGGENWEHLSPVRWAGLFGGAAILLNAGAIIGSAGVGIPLLVASVAVGVAGLASGV